MQVSKLSPKAANALLFLAFSGDGLQGARLDSKFRGELVAARLIETETGKNGAKALHLREEGWSALAEAFPELPKSGRKTAPTKAKPKSKPKPTKLAEVETLNAVLKTLRAFMDANGLSLADLLTRSKAPAPRQPVSSAVPRNGTAGSDEAKVVQTYIVLARTWGQEVRLAALRQALTGMSREHVDAALTHLREQGRLTPYPIENARELKTEDEDAALLLGVTRHHYVRIREG
jgi:hypothetical protein